MCKCVGADVARVTAWAIVGGMLVAGEQGAVLVVGSAHSHTFMMGKAHAFVMVMTMDQSPSSTASVAVPGLCLLVPVRQVSVQALDWLPLWGGQCGIVCCAVVLLCLVASTAGRHRCSTAV